MCAANKIQLKSGYQRKAMALELYLSLFGLHDPTKKFGNALDLVCMTNKEGHWRQGPLPRRMEDYRLCKIKDRYGLSFDEWIDRPRYEVEYMIDLCLRENERDAVATGQHLDHVNQLMNDLKIPKDRFNEVSAAVKSGGLK